MDLAVLLLTFKKKKTFASVKLPRQLVVGLGTGGLPFSA
jgi:hypothetical protein